MAKVNKANCFYPPSCPGCSNCDPLRPMPTTQDLVNAVKTYALDHYEKGGWDIVIECYGDAEIAECIGGAKTEKGAIRKVRERMNDIDGYRKEIQATAC